MKLIQLFLRHSELCLSGHFERNSSVLGNSSSSSFFFSSFFLSSFLSSVFAFFASGSFSIYPPVILCGVSVVGKYVENVDVKE